MKKFTSIIFILLFAGVTLSAHTIHLKNGKTLNCEKCWRKGEKLKIKSSSGVSTISYDRVDYIEYEYTGKSKKPDTSTDKNKNNSTDKNKNNKKTSSENPPTKSPASSKKDIKIGDIYKLESQLDDSENKKKIKIKLASMYNRLGLKKMNNGKFSRAENHFRSALLYTEKRFGPKINLASSLIKQEKQYEAKDFLMRAVLDHPKNGVLHYLLGKTYYHFNDLEKALKEFQKSYDLKPKASTQKSIRRLKKEIKMTKNNVGTESSHFVVSHKYGKDPEVIDEILDSLEDSYSRISSKLDIYPDSRITVVVMPSKKFYKFTGKPGWVGGIFDGKIRIPTKGLKTVDRKAKRILTHELTHALIFSKARGKTPRWLHEGLAQLMEGRKPDISSERIAKNNGFGIPFKWIGSRSYKPALSFVNFLVDEYGFFRINNFLEKLAESDSVEKVAKDVYYGGLKEQRDKWLDTLSEK